MELQLGQEVFVRYRGEDRGYAHYVGSGHVVMDEPLDADFPRIYPSPSERAGGEQVVPLSAIEIDVEMPDCYDAAIRQMGEDFYRRLIEAASA